MKSNAFCSWSGGKDSCFALHRASLNPEIEVKYLVNMVNKEGKIGHGLDPRVFEIQARALDLDIKQKEVTWDTYEKGFKETVGKLDVGHGVFGDIELEGHREWVENVCSTLRIDPILPLWGEEPEELFKEFIEKHESVIIKIDSEKIERGWLGESLSEDFFEYLVENDLHPMGENGEYHTFVINGPLFKRSLKIDENKVEDVEDRSDFILHFGVEEV